MAEPVYLKVRQVLDVLGIGHKRWGKLLEDGAPEPTDDGVPLKELVRWWVEYRVQAVIGVHDDDQGGPQQKIIEQEERARWYKARADAQERENAIALGELVRADVLEELLEKPVAEVAAALDALPSQLKNDIPHLRGPDVHAIEKRLARVRNQLARYEFSITDAA